MGKRNAKIDFWKFIFSILVLIYHSKVLRDGIVLPLGGGGSIGVEFFFIVSGYLMVDSFERQKKSGNRSRDTFYFLKRKVVSLIPAMWAGGIIGICVRRIIKKSTLEGWIKAFADNIWSFLLIDFSGIRGTPANGVTWYVSAMLLIMLILYPLMHKDKEMFLTVVAPLVSIFSFGYLYQNFNNPRGPDIWLGFCYKGVVRGFAEICLGAVCYVLAQKMRECRLTSAGYVFFSFMENICYIAVLYAGCAKGATKYDYVLILMLAVAICCSFSGQTAKYSFLDKIPTKVLADFGFYIYLGHYSWARSLNLVFPTLNYGSLFMIYIACTAFSALLIYFLSGIIKKALRKGATLLFAGHDNASTAV